MAHSNRDLLFRLVGGFAPPVPSYVHSRGCVWWHGRVLRYCFRLLYGNRTVRVTYPYRIQKHKQAFILYLPRSLTSCATGTAHAPALTFHEKVYVVEPSDSDLSEVDDDVVLALYSSQLATGMCVLQLYCFRGKERNSSTLGIPTVRPDIFLRQKLQCTEDGQVYIYTLLLNNSSGGVSRAVLFIQLRSCTLCNNK